MKSKHPTTSPPIRDPFQKSIPSTFIFRSGPKINDSSSIDTSNHVESRSRLSLSAFLDRKLSSSCVGSIDMKNTSNFRDDRYKFGVPRQEPVPAIEDSVFKLFNGTQAGKVERTSSQVFNDTTTTTTTTTTTRSESSIKKNSRNHMVVLGDDPKPKRRVNSVISSSNNKPRPLYNHYENGTGWWDSEREGVDNDEVGAKEVWEGMGTTTLGGLDQHF